jgi:hypothetical protein
MLVKTLLNQFRQSQMYTGDEKGTEAAMWVSTSLRVCHFLQVDDGNIAKAKAGDLTLLGPCQ